MVDRGNVLIPICSYDAATYGRSVVTSIWPLFEYFLLEPLETLNVEGCGGSVMAKGNGFEPRGSSSVRITFVFGKVYL